MKARCALSLCAIFIVFSSVNNARAGVLLQYGGFEWDSDAAGITSTLGVSSTVTINNFPRSGFLADNPDFNPSLNDTTTGRQLGGDGPFARAATLGNRRDRGSISYLFNTLPNDGPGDDLVIFEQGDPGEPELFMVRLHLDDGTSTDWRYERYDSFQAFPIGFTGGAFATGFDLASFGVLAGLNVLEMEVANMIASDRVSDPDGQGFVRVLGQDLYDVAYMPIATVSGYREFNPDFVYTAAINFGDGGPGGQAEPTPEPSTIALSLVGAGLAIAASRRRRKTG